jgi:hypothetical protein
MEGRVRLERLQLTNFQKFRKLLLEFDPQATTIVGDSDRGKSTILRALGFLLLNRSIRGQLVHRGKAFAKVSAEIDGKRLARVKGKKNNKYVFDGRRYAAIGKANVPDGIAAFLNVGPENFQRQLDAHFWFSDTAGQVSKKLNEIVNLEVIDRSLSNLGKRLTEAKNEVRDLDQRVKADRKAKLDLKWVLAFDQELKGIEAKKNIWQETALACSRLQIGTRKAAFLTRQAKNADTGALEGQNALLLGRKAARTAGEVKALREFILDMEAAERAALWDVPDIGPLLDRRRKADRVAEERRELEGLILEHTELEDEQCRRQKELEQLTSHLTKIGRKCPKCGQALPSRNRPESGPHSSDSPTCISPPDPRSSARRSLTGIRRWSDKSSKS